MGKGHVKEMCLQMFLDNRSAWRKLWRPSASSGMNGRDDEDDDDILDKYGIESECSLPLA